MYASIRTQGVRATLQEVKRRAYQAEPGLQVIAKSSITHKDGFSAKPPSVWLSFSKDLEFGSTGPTRKHPDSLESALNKSGRRLVSFCMLWFETFIAAPRLSVSSIAEAGR